MSLAQNLHDRLGISVLRASIVLIFLWFGWMKFLPYEAEGVAGIASDYWAFGWLYPLVGVHGASAVIGVLEVATGLVLALGWYWPLASILGGAMGCATFAVTLSFMLVAPAESVWHSPPGFPALGSTGQFLIKDIVILAGCFLIGLDGLKHVIIKKELS